MSGTYIDIILNHFTQPCKIKFSILCNFCLAMAMADLNEFSVIYAVAQVLIGHGTDANM